MIDLVKNQIFNNIPGLENNITEEIFMMGVVEKSETQLLANTIVISVKYMTWLVRNQKKFHQKTTTVNSTVIQIKNLLLDNVNLYMKSKTRTNNILLNQLVSLKHIIKPSNAT